MEEVQNAPNILSQMRKLRQIRQYSPDPIPEDVITELLQIARWTGSSRNDQPWHFIVIDDREKLREISTLRQPVHWVANAPLAIAIVLDGENPTSEAYDEGRVSERVMIAAHMLGIGSGTAWFGDESQRAQAKQILGIPEKFTARSVVTLGYPAETQAPRRSAVSGGRRPLNEIVSRNTLSAK